MRGRIAGAIVVAVLLGSAAPAVSQEPRTSLEPLDTLLNDFTSGVDHPGITGPAAGPALRQLQVWVSLGGGPAFGESGVDLTYVGYDSAGSLANLDDVFRRGTLIPPLDPNAAGGEGGTVLSRFGDWEIFDDTGPVDEVVLAEQPVVVWGMELAEPFDTSCAQGRTVGRTWRGDSLVDTEPPFSAEALNNSFGPGFEPLAGETSRILHLTCFAGAAPRVESRRMTEDIGVRPLTPEKSVAMVKDQFVVFFTPNRVLDGQFDPFWFSGKLDGTPIETGQTTSGVNALVPNPYDDLPVRMAFIFDNPEAAAPQVGEPQGLTLLYRPDGVTSMRAGTGDDVGTVVYFEEDVLELGEGRSYEFFMRDHSISGRSEVKGGRLELVTTFPDGRKLFRRIDPSSKRYEYEVMDPDGATVTGEGDVEIEGGEGAPATGGGSDETPTDVGSTDAEGDTPADAGGAPATTSDDGSNLLLFTALGFAVLLFLAFLYWWFVLRNKPSGPAYRADRWGDLEITEPDDAGDEPQTFVAEPVDDLPPAVVEEPDTSFEDPCWEEYRKLAAAQERVVGLEAELRDAEPSDELTAAARRRAIDNAKDNLAYAQRVHDECVAKHRPQSPDAPPPPDEPPAPPADRAGDEEVGGTPAPIGGETVGGTRERGPDTPGVVVEGDDGLSPPHDGDETRTRCDWSVYLLTGTADGPQVVRKARGHECCKYTISIETRIDEAEWARKGRQDDASPDSPEDETDGRLKRARMWLAFSGLSVWTGALALSGPHGRQDWMHGDGDPRPPEDRFPEPREGPIEQVATLEEPLDVAAFGRYVETTTIRCTLESECPDHVSTFEINGESDVAVEGGQECTNTAIQPDCPVELAAAGKARIVVSSHRPYEVSVAGGADPDELDRARPRFATRTDSHDHNVGGRSHFTDNEHGHSGRHELVQDGVEIKVTNELQFEAGTIVPTAVAPDTERVGADFAAWAGTVIEVNADMRRTTCAVGDCCGHGGCVCDPSFELTVDEGGAIVKADGGFGLVSRRFSPGQTWS